MYLNQLVRPPVKNFSLVFFVSSLVFALAVFVYGQLFVNAQTAPRIEIVSGQSSSYILGSAVTIKITLVNLLECPSGTPVSARVYKRLALDQYDPTPVWNQYFSSVSGENCAYQISFTPGSSGGTLMAGETYKFQIESYLANQTIKNSFDFVIASVACTVSDWDCADWSACETNSQTRVCTLRNTSCQNPEAVRPNLIQSCQSSPISCTAFTCLAWSGCNGTNTIEYCNGGFDRFPSGCVGNPSSSDYTRSCQLLACKPEDWNCANWSACDSSGQKYRGCTLQNTTCSNPEAVKPVTSQSCQPDNNTTTACLDFSCAAWSGCSASASHETCTNIIRIPSGCIGQAPANISYRACPINNEPIANCTYEAWSCSLFGPCNNALKSRACTLRDTKCLYPELVKPKEVESCSSSVNASDWTVQTECMGIRYNCKDIVCTNGIKYGCPVVYVPAGCSYTEKVINEVNCCPEPWSCVEECRSDNIKYRVCRPTEGCSASLTKADPSTKLGACVFQSATKTNDVPASTPETTRPTETTANNNPNTPRSTDEENRSAFDDESSEETKPSAEKPESGVNTQVADSTPLKSPELDEACRQAKISDQTTCDIFVQGRDLPSKCYAANVKTKYDCRQLLEQQGLLKQICSNYSPVECGRLINTVILADFVEQELLVQKQAKATQISNQIISVRESNGRTELTSSPIITELGKHSTEGTALTDADAIRDILPIKAESEASNLLVLNSQVNNANKNQILGAVLLIDTDKDGLSDDLETRIGTNPKLQDSDGDNYYDLVEIRAKYNPLGQGPITAELLKKIAPVDWAVIKQAKFEEPKANNKKPNQDLQVGQVVNQASKLKLSGSARPEELVTLYLYSQMPLVLTVRADKNGNWVYDLDKPLVDGKHEIYVAINDDQGRVVANSSPLSFFIKEAKAVTMDQYISDEQLMATVPDSSSKMLVFYITGGSALVFAALLLFMTIRKFLYR